MEAKLTKAPFYLKVTLKGDLDLYNAPHFKDKLLEELSSNPKHLLFDLKELNYIDSSGIGVLINLFTYLKKHNKQLILAYVTTQVLRILDMTSLTGLFTITPDMGTALIQIGDTSCTSEQIK